MKKRKSASSIVIALFLLLMAAGIVVGKKVYASDRIFIPNQAVRKGNKIYWAMYTFDCGYPIHCYDLKTKKDRIVDKQEQRNGRQLSIKGKYLYYVDEKFNGSVASDYYIQRMRVNGSGKQELAAGCSPAIIGNFIYYIGLEKGRRTRDGEEPVDVKATGIYRMNLTGKKKKCIYKFTTSLTESASGIKLYGAKDKLIFRTSEKGKWYKLSLKNRKRTSYSWKKRKPLCNTTTESYNAYDLSSVLGNVSNNNKGYRYTAEGDTLYRIDQGREDIVTMFPEEHITRIFDLNGYLFVITCTDGNAQYSNGGWGPCKRAYVLKEDGTEKKRLFSDYPGNGSD